MDVLAHEVLMGVGDDPPSPIPGHVGSVWRHFLVVMLGRQVVLAPGGQSPEVLFEHLQSTGWPATQSHPAKCQLERPALAGYTML